MNEVANNPQVERPTDAAIKRFPCRQCGAKLIFKPGTASLTCEYCGFVNPIPRSEDQIRELDFREYLARQAGAAEVEEVRSVKCGACGAEIEPPEQAAAFACPFCGTDIVTTAATKRLIKPKALLPFRVTREVAWESFRKWLKTRWFAPNALKKHARTGSRLSGVYTPYWTYDSNTTSFYRGARGDDYWVTVGTGKNKRRVRRTSWTSVSGTVWNRFDDVLVMASNSLPRKYADRLTPWDLNNLTPYNDEYLSGFRAERYQIDLAQGFGVAKEIMDDAIRASIRRDIGGDHQRIHSVNTQYDDITFKHILLPVWISAYRFKERTFRFLVNARTGEVQGERPYSWIKITLFVLMCAALAAAGAYVYGMMRG